LFNHQRLQERLASLEESPVVRVDPNISTSKLWVPTGEKFEQSTAMNVNVNVNSEAMPADEHIGFKKETFVIPYSKQVYALGVVKEDPSALHITSREQRSHRLLLTEIHGKPFVLDYGSEDELYAQMRSSGSTYEMIGNVLVAFGGIALVHGAYGLATHSEK